MTLAVGYLPMDTPVFDGLRDEWVREYPDWTNEVSAMARLVRDPFAKVSRYPARYLSEPGVIPGEIVCGDSVVQGDKISATSEVADGDLVSASPQGQPLILGPAMVAKIQGVQHEAAQ